MDAGSAMRVLVTRPAAQAQLWVDRLHAAHIDAAALPLIEITAAADPAPVRQAWHDLSRYRLVLFVSPNAVEQFYALRPPGAVWPAGSHAASPGPGTRASLQAQGIPADQVLAPADDATQFDSESLWATLRDRDWTGAHVLFVRGAGGRDWLAERLSRAGASVSHVAAYRRGPPVWDGAQQAEMQRALARPRHTLWWFSSAEAIDHLATLAPADAPWARARALATHPRIAERARALGFGRVDEARPAADEVLDAIGRILESGPP